MVVIARALREEIQSILIPVASIRDSFSAPPAVMLVDRNTSTVHEQVISTGQLVGDMIEITAGLGGGELVIITGQHRVLPGDVVTYEMLKNQPLTR